jgi:hypothetical protein
VKKTAKTKRTQIRKRKIEHIVITAKIMGKRDKVGKETRWSDKIVWYKIKYRIYKQPWR